MKHDKNTPILRLVSGTIMGAVGFLLSPLSWWNDLVVNVPLAFIFAFGVAKLFALFAFDGPNVFLILFVIGYWLTNIAGFMLMHRGIKILKGEPVADHRREIRNSIIWSLVYTILIVAVVKVSDAQSLLAKYLHP